MASILRQRDLVVTLKKETILNIGILNKLNPLSTELYRYILRENALEKPTQNQFNHLSYYLVNVIDPHIAASLPWPLYDSKTERAYRNELANFISDYSTKGLLSPIMSSYLVNPGCYKVTILIFQLSQLAIQRELKSIMRDRHKKLYNEVTDKYKYQQDDGFIEYIENETDIMVRKFANYLNKRKILEKVAELLRSRILAMEAKLEASNAQKYINNLIDLYIKHHPDETVEQELLKIKDVKGPCTFFDTWLSEIDNLTDKLELDWDVLFVPLLKSGTSALENSKELIGRHMGQIDKSLFTLEYNPQTDAISTKELQQQVNSEQKFILKNIEKDGRLNFPSLIRSFVIAICYILKNNEIGNEIYKFNEYLDLGVRNYSEITSALKIVNERILNAESKLQVVPVNMNQSLSSKEVVEIPPLPDLSTLKTHPNNKFLFESFTPLVSKHQFNLRRNNISHFIKRQSSFLTTQLSVPKDDFFKTLIKCHRSTHDRPNTTQNFLNISIMSHANKANETIAECSSGFTKQQILRLMSTKKTSSSKKHKYKMERPKMNIIQGGLFHESITSNESSGLFRSYSSPNLFENREKRSIPKGRVRKLSIMQEDSPNSLLELSGIAALDKDSNHSTPQGTYCLANAQLDTSSQPIISITRESESRINNILNNFQVDMNKEIINGSMDSQKSITEHKSEELNELHTTTETPKTNVQVKAITTSLEKIINRFKKVRANVLPSETSESPKTIETIVEEKEKNFNMVNVDCTANRILLPDLLSPSYNALSTKTVKYYDDYCLDINDEQPRKPRESLGTLLGVDHTFLDQCDLID